MRIGAPSRRCIAAASSSTATAAAMFSPSRPITRGRRPWGRSFCCRPPYWDSRGEEGAFVSGDSHLRTVRDANYGHRQGYGGNFGPPGGGPRPKFYPRPPFSVFRPPPRPRPADYRSWVPSTAPPPPPQCVQFRVLSYNILADYLARDHRSELYFHIPPYILDWGWRKRRLLVEFGLWSPDIMCLQEVDRFQDLEEELTIQGYIGVWKMRTGNAVDGCAIFWRTNRFILRHEEDIEFNKLGLRDNIAQICVLESRSQSPVENGSAPMAARRADQVVVCNIHVLYNPKRGEIKLGQVRVLLDRAYSVSRAWNDAPVIICGDFNSTPKSSLYNFISEQKLNLSGLARDKLSGQYRACLHAMQPNLLSGLYRGRPSRDNNDVKAAPVEQSNCHTGIYNQQQPQKDMQNAPPKDSSSSPCVSEKPCSYVDPMAKELSEGYKLDDRFTESSNRDSLRGAVEAINELSMAAGDMKIEGGEELASPEIPHHDNLLSGEVKPDHGNKDVNSSCSSRGMTKEEYSESNPGVSDEHINSLHLDMSYKNEELFNGSSGSLDEMNNMSKFYSRNHTIMTVQDDFVGYRAQKENITSCKSMPSPEGNIDAFISVRKNDKPSSDLTTIQEKTGLPIHSKIFHQNKPVDSSICGDSPLDVDLIDSSSNVTDKYIKDDASSADDHETTDAYGKLLEKITDDASSQNTDCHSRLIRPHPVEAIRYTASSSGPCSSQLEDYGSTVSEITSESFSSGLCHLENTDCNFLKELHGTGNIYEFGEVVSVTSFSSQTPSLSPSLGQGVGDKEINFDRLDSGVQHQPQLDLSGIDVQKNIYDPYLLTPMEIEAASGNAECTILEHNLKLMSAYTEAEDIVGTKDSSGEPQVTSYHRQFMGTVDYIWHSEGIQTVRVLDTIPKHVLQQTPGFPTKKWGSDHLAIACEFAFVKGPTQ